MDNILVKINFMHLHIREVNKAYNFPLGLTKSFITLMEVYPKGI